MPALARRLAPLVRVPSQDHPGARRQAVLAAVRPGDRQARRDKTLVSYLLEHDQSFPGVEVQQSYLRTYPLGDVAAPILGYLGEIDPQQLKQPRYKGYLPDDEVGQSGVEATYDRWLRARTAQPGSRSTPWANQRRIVPGGSLPQPGDNLVLTLDARIQKAAEQAIQFGIASAHANGFLRPPTAARPS